MSFLGGMLGGSGGNGAQFQAAGPQNSSIVSPTDVRQFQGKLDSGLNQQQSLYDTLAAQNGVGNQSAVFAQQQALANTLGQQAQGIGPNPAMAQLAQATSANTANQAALMAGQRGTSGNAGLIARQAAMQGGANQQAAVGQGASMQAQQQLASQQQLMQQQQNMAGLAGTQVGQQQQQGNAYTQNSLGATTGFLNAATGLQSNANNVNGGVASQNAKGQYGLLGGISSAAGMAFAHGGQVPAGYAMGGDVQGGQGGSALAAFMNGQIGGFQPGQDVSMGMPKMGGKKDTAPTIAGGPGDNMGMPSMDPMGAQGGGAFMSESPSLMMAAAHGAQVPGRPNVKGDSPKNDTVPAMLSPGEVVIPNHIMQSKDAAKKAAAFVAAIIAKNGRVA